MLKINFSLNLTVCLISATLEFQINVPPLVNLSNFPNPLTLWTLFGHPLEISSPRWLICINSTLRKFSLFV